MGEDVFERPVPGTSGGAAQRVDPTQMQFLALRVPLGALPKMCIFTDNTSPQA